MTFRGAELEKDGDLTLCRVVELSDDLRNLIRKNLAAITRGAHQTEQLPDLYNYKNTLKSFMSRFVDKSEETKMGMIGELLAHLLIPNFFSSLSCLSILFNKEEQSIKKGFDIIYVSTAEQVLWYSEVKSGHKNKLTPDDANVGLLDRAFKDLKKKLSEGPDSLWDAALTDVSLVLDHKKAPTAQNLLSKDSPLMSKPTPKNKNAFLISVLYETTASPIALQKIRQYASKVQPKGVFKSIIVFSIQKGTYQKVAKFLEDEVASA